MCTFCGHHLQLFWTYGTPRDPRESGALPARANHPCTLTTRYLLVPPGVARLGSGDLVVQTSDVGNSCITKTCPNSTLMPMRFATTDFKPLATRWTVLPWTVTRPPRNATRNGKHSMRRWCVGSCGARMQHTRSSRWVIRDQPEETDVFMGNRAGQQWSFRLQAHQCTLAAGYRAHEGREPQWRGRIGLWTARRPTARRACPWATRDLMRT